MSKVKTFLRVKVSVKQCGQKNVDILECVISFLAHSCTRFPCYLGMLTLFTPGGGHIVPPCHVFVYKCSNTLTSALKKLDFSYYEFGIGHYAFYRMKLSRFAEKTYDQKYRNFIRGDPYKPSRVATLTTLTT